MGIIFWSILYSLSGIIGSYALFCVHAFGQDIEEYSREQITHDMAFYLLIVATGPGAVVMAIIAALDYKFTKFLPR